MADYYKILGVSPTATAKEIDRAFYKVKSKFSSEDIEDPYFKNFYRRILEAYNVLGNEKLRSQYDKNYSPEEIKNIQKNDLKEISVSPVIEYFKTSKTVIDREGSAVLSWKTSMADEVILAPTGKVARAGSKIILFSDLDEQKDHFILKALNKTSGEEVTEHILIEKAIQNTKEEEYIPSENNIDKNKEEKKPDKTLTIEDRERKDSDGKNIKKFAIPSGVVILLIAIILFVIGKSGFWQSSSQLVSDESVTSLNPNEEDTEEVVDNLPEVEKEIFTEYRQTLKGQEIKYYNPEEVFTELLAEIDKNTVSNIPGFEADVRQFFNGSSNPIEWENSNYSGNNLVLNSEINVGVKQEPYSENRNKIAEKLQLSKMGNYDSRILKRLRFTIEDSGPPFWEPNNKWKAFQKIFKSEFDKIILTDELNRKKEIYAINEIPKGYSKGYILQHSGVILPVSFSKKIAEDYPTAIEINFLASMNSLLKRDENLNRNEKELRILNLLELEDYRDFQLVSQFYADKVLKYWENNDLDYQGLKSLYQTAWSNTKYSFNDVQNIKMLNDRNFELITDFKYLNKEGDTISQLSSTHYTFNEKGLIEEVYGVDSDYTFQDFRDSDFDFIDQNEKIRRFLKAENNRKFNKIASFYSADMKRYWYVEDPTFNQIKKIYEDAWGASSYSQNTLLNIEKSAYNTYDVKVRFTFHNNKANQPETRERFTRYIFNEKGLIEEVYGLKDSRR